MRLQFFLLLIVLLNYRCNCLANDFYDIMGISKNADQREIRKAFKRLALLYHPDKNQGDDDAQEKFLQINRAYEILKDEESRQRYDLYGDEGTSGSNDRRYWNQHYYRPWNYYENFGIYDDDEEIVTLRGSDFDESVLKNDNDMWFINFYSPLCSHCHYLAPVWRKIAKKLQGDVRVGAVNCEEDWALCHSCNVHSYPSLILYFKGIPHHYHGERTVDDLIDFVTDALNPRVMSLTTFQFNDQVTNKLLDELWIVDFYAPWCGPCQRFEPQFNKLGKLLANVGKVRLGKVDCTFETTLCDDEGIRSYPTVRLYPFGRSDYQTFKEYNKDAFTLHSWVYQYLPSDVKELDNNAFYNEVIYNSEPWIVDFYAPWCGHCHRFAPEFENIAKNLSRQGIRAGKVNCETTRYVCQQASVSAYPTIRVYMDSTKPRNEYGREINTQDASIILSLVGKWLENYENNVCLKIG